MSWIFVFLWLSQAHASDCDQFLKLVAEAGVQFEAGAGTLFSKPVLIKTALADELPQRVIRAVIKLADQSVDYLNAPTLQDFFPSHPERRAWRMEMAALHGDAFTNFYNSNKLRSNVLHALRGRFELLAAMGAQVDQADPLVARLFEVVEHVPDVSEYNAFSLAQKLDMVRQWEQKATEFLESVAAMPPSTARTAKPPAANTATW